MLRVLDLFSGIGGISLGLESTGGFETVAFCEIEPFCREVLKQHWPEVPVYDDVRRLSASTLGGLRPDCIVGGFPCQPFSVAGKQQAQSDERHLWPHFARLIRELRPRWVIAENVPGIRTLAADEVLEDLEAAGYSCWPLVVGADDVGAPHRRKRVWFVARLRLADSDGERESDANELRRSSGTGWSGASDAGGRGAALAHRDETGRSAGLRCVLQHGVGAAQRDDADRRGEECLAHAECWPGGRGPGLSCDGELGGSQACDGEAGIPGITGDVPPRWPARPGEQQHDWEEPRLVGNAGGGNRNRGTAAGQQGEAGSAAGRGQGSPQQPVGSATDGLPLDMVRLARRGNREALKAAGNSVVPQVVAAIGRAILEVERLTA